MFDLSAVEMFPHKTKVNNTDSSRSNRPVYPDEWKNQFGLPVEKHRQVFQVSLFDKFAVFSVKSPSSGSSSENIDDCEKG